MSTEEEEDVTISKEELKAIIAHLHELDTENKRCRAIVKSNNKQVDQYKKQISSYLKKQSEVTGLDYSSITFDGVVIKCGTKKRERKNQKEIKESIKKVIEEDVLGADGKAIDMDEIVKKVENARKGDECHTDDLKISFPKKS